MKVQLPLGDVVDKVTILLLKQEHIADAAKQANVRRELEVLLFVFFVCKRCQFLGAGHELEVFLFGFFVLKG